MLDYPVEGSSSKGLAKKIGQAILNRLVVPGPNLWTGLEISYIILKKYYSHLDLRRHQHQEASWLYTTLTDLFISRWSQTWKKFPTSFSLLVKNFCFSLVFCENFQYLITFNEVSKSADGLQIRLNLANPKIKNSVVKIFDSNSSNGWRMIFQNPKKFQNIIFHSKVIANLNIYRFSQILGHLLIKCMGKTHIEFTVELCGKF